MRNGRVPPHHRPDVGGAHIGLAVTLVALTVVVTLSDPRWALVVGGVSVLWFAAALCVVRRRGARGGNAMRRAYNATFGWGDMV